MFYINKKDERIGERNKSNQGYWMEIIDYKNIYDCTVKFEEVNGVEYIAYNVEYHKFKNGSVKNLFAPSSFGVGYIGNTKTKENKKTKKSFSKWQDMISRCYSKEDRMNEKYPTYKECEVCDEWKCFANFEKWFNDHYYEIEGTKVQLDKDILYEGNKIYSPKTCAYVPVEINQIFKGQSKRVIDKDLPTGVGRRNNKYYAQIGYNKKHYFLGTYNTPQEAYTSYLIKKKEILFDLAEKYKQYLDDKIYNKLINYDVDYEFHKFYP